MDTKILGFVLASLLLMPAALAVTTPGAGVGINLTTEEFKPLIWMCDHRVVLDDNVEPGRNGGAGTDLTERTNNYAFTGEQIQWRVLVMDKNGVEKIKDVYIAIANDTSGDLIEANCVLETNHTDGESLDSSCNARIDEEQLTTFDSTTMAYYTCTFTVESRDRMHGEYWVHAVVEDLDDQTATVDEDEYWFFNPEITLSIENGPVSFGTVRPGTVAYSQTIKVGNNAEEGSGVMLDMFISGTDFYDPAHSGAKCPDSNVLELTNFAYYAVNGAYSTLDDPRSDDEGYVLIGYGDHFDNTFYTNNEILQVGLRPDGYYAANILSPGAEMSITFRLSLPEPCNGDFTDGNIYFWGEAI